MQMHAKLWLPDYEWQAPTHGGLFYPLQDMLSDQVVLDSGIQLTSVGPPGARKKHRVGATRQKLLQSRRSNNLSQGEDDTGSPSPSLRAACCHLVALCAYRLGWYQLNELSEMIVQVLLDAAGLQKGFPLEGPEGWLSATSRFRSALFEWLSILQNIILDGNEDTCFQNLVLVCGVAKPLGDMELDEDPPDACLHRLATGYHWKGPLCRSSVGPSLRNERAWAPGISDDGDGDRRCFRCPRHHRHRGMLNSDEAKDALSIVAGWPIESTLDRGGRNGLENGTSLTIQSHASVIGTLPVTDEGHPVWASPS